MVKINGNAVPTPSVFRVSFEEVGGGQDRSAAGGAVKDFIGTRRRLKLRWAHLSAAALKGLLSAVDGAFFEASFPDPATGGERVAECWCAARSMGVLRVTDGAPVWTDIEMEWIER